MSTSLDRRAYNLIRSHKAKQRQDQKKREKTARINAKAKLSKEQILQNTERAKRQADFEARQAAAKKATEAAQTQRDEELPREAQLPKAEGPLAGRFIGAINKGKLDAAGTIVLESKAALVALAIVLDAAFVAAAAALDQFGANEDIMNAANGIAEAQGQVESLATQIDLIDLGGVATIFRARKGEK